MLVEKSEFRMSNGMISGCTASISGGGMSIDVGAVAIIEHSTIEGCTSQQDGSIATFDSDDLLVATFVVFRWAP